MTRYLNDPPDAHESASHQDPQEIQKELRQTHFPMLEEADIITYDREKGTFERGANFEAVGLLLDTLETDDAEH